jgi:hypothetical protein
MNEKQTQTITDILAMQAQANYRLNQIIEKLNTSDTPDQEILRMKKLGLLSFDLELKEVVEELRNCMELFKILVEVLEKIKEAQIPDNLQQILDACQYQAKGIEELNYQFKILQQKQERNEAILLTVLEELRALSKSVKGKK